MRILVDTSALYALLDRDDANHADAERSFADLRRRASELVTHNYVLVEAAALVHRRLGPAATRALLEDLLLPVEVIWVDRDLHRRAESALLAAARRRLSLVDWTSFEVMRRLGVRSAFAFDRDFAAEGFALIP